ncbi:MAG: response regulator [Proteobacteria bacterium]|nr:response regulator [Pseudomonadota bacterium]
MIKLIVKEALLLLRASLPSTIEIRQDLASDATVMADPTQIHQVVMNLCTNAAHSMSESGGLLRINLGETSEPPSALGLDKPGHRGRWLVLEIRDTGQGMTRDIMDRIFDPFFTTKERGAGTGMGLSVVHGIVSSYSGYITVESKVAQGSVFSVFLPVIEDEAVMTSATRTPLSRGTERILFVDDELYQIDLIKQMLEHLGYTVVAENDSQKALARFASAPRAFDLVITDMTMPQMTGDRLANKILEIRPDTPIIICTGYSERFGEEEARRIGIKSFAYKPIRMNDLARMIRSVLDEKEDRLPKPV